MKPKEISTIIIYLLAVLSFSAFAHDAWDSSASMGSHVTCSDKYYYYRDNKKINAKYWFTWTNSTSYDQNITVTYRLCMLEKCDQKVDHYKLIPGQKMTSLVHEIYINVHQDNAGRYPFVSTSSISGDVAKEETSICHLIVNK